MSFLEGHRSWCPIEYLYVGKVPHASTSFLEGHGSWVPYRVFICAQGVTCIHVLPPSYQHPRCCTNISGATSVTHKGNIGVPQPPPCPPHTLRTLLLASPPTLNHIGGPPVRPRGVAPPNLFRPQPLSLRHPGHSLGHVPWAWEGGGPLSSSSAVPPPSPPLEREVGAGRPLSTSTSISLGVCDWHQGHVFVQLPQPREGVLLDQHWRSSRPAEGSSHPKSSNVDIVSLGFCDCHQARCGAVDSTWRGSTGHW